ncbi:MAG: DegT/DnrJ/EryC1/StrS family aminotransferase [Thiobacillaceae bacterium]|nr:DegT/DnrJ/EryC1/StrS family aminotransferase [Thiobacillaceae bacterium]
MNIPMVDLKAEYALLRAELEPAVLEVLASAHYIGGPNVRAFEQEVAAYCGVKHAISCASGTDALLLALRACDIGPGDEVITTPFTFVATASTIAMCGARPVFVDIDRRTYNLDPARIEAAITPRTRAVVPVHLYGQPADLAPMAELCRRHGLKLIEDAAQSFGAEYGGRKSGAYGDVGCFSFYPSKNLGAFGDGGMVVTDDDALAERLRVLANHGSRVRYHHDLLGYNSRLDELQAAILRVKLKRIDDFNAARRRIAQAYNERLAGSAVETPYEDGKGLHVYHQYTLQSDRREAIQAALTAAGIASAIYYPVPLHRQALFADACQGLSLPVAEAAAQRVLSLPISPTLGEAQIERICAVVRGA